MPIYSTSWIFVEIKKKIQLRFKSVYFEFIKHIYGELIHTNQNSVCLIYINLIIMKVILQTAHYWK